MLVKRLDDDLAMVELTTAQMDRIESVPTQSRNRCLLEGNSWKEITIN
jgi:hypothetical protein